MAAHGLRRPPEVEIYPSLKRLCRRPPLEETTTEEEMGGDVATEKEEEEDVSSVLIAYSFPSPSYHPLHLVKQSSTSPADDMAARGLRRPAEVDICTPLKRLCREEDVQQRRGLRLQTGSAYLAMEGKMSPLGEDAHFVCGNAFGVADGVGSWARRGIDSGAFARELMGFAKEEFEGVRPVLLPESVLERAVARTQSPGTSTACIAVLLGEELRAANLGDSGFLVVRGGTVVYRTPVQQKGFNKPYQVGGTTPIDPPSCAQSISFLLQPDDIIVAGTDGLFDNMFDDDIAAILADARGLGWEDPGLIAWAVAEMALLLSEDWERVSPFALAATGRQQWTGGKPDDITVIVSKVVTTTTGDMDQQ